MRIKWENRCIECTIPVNSFLYFQAPTYQEPRKYDTDETISAAQTHRNNRSKVRSSFFRRCALTTMLVRMYVLPNALSKLPALMMMVWFLYKRNHSIDVRFISAPTTEESAAAVALTVESVMLGAKPVSSMMMINEFIAS